MSTIQFVTVEGCPEARCPRCEELERLLRTVLKLLEVELPPHAPLGREVHIAEDQTVEIAHLSCQQAQRQDLDPAEAPFLFVDDQLVSRGARLDEDGLARTVLEALRPHGLADLRR